MYADADKYAEHKLFASASLTAFQPDKYADALIVAG
jgi:hypothetical protein